MGPSEGFGEGQEAFDPMQVGHELGEGSDGGGGGKIKLTAWLLVKPYEMMTVAVGAEQAGLDQPKPL
jgi:hypothetical protein